MAPQLHIKDSNLISEPPSIEGYVTHVKAPSGNYEKVYLIVHNGLLFMLQPTYTYCLLQCLMVAIQPLCMEELAKVHNMDVVQLATGQLHITPQHLWDNEDDRPCSAKQPLNSWTL